MESVSSIRASVVFANSAVAPPSRHVFCVTILPPVAVGGVGYRPLPSEGHVAAAGVVLAFRLCFRAANAAEGGVCRGVTAGRTPHDHKMFVGIDAIFSRLTLDLSRGDTSHTTQGIMLYDPQKHGIYLSVSPAVQPRLT